MTEEIMNDIDKLDGMIKIKGKCGYEIIGGCSDLRRLKQQHNDDTEEIAKLGLDVAILEQENKSNKELLIIAQNEAMEAQFDREKYKNALEEIKSLVRGHKVADEVRLKSILDKINEVLGC